MPKNFQNALCFCQYLNSLMGFIQNAWLLNEHRTANAI